MRNVWTIAKRELNMYFTSPVAYAIIVGTLVILGFFFFFFDLRQGLSFGQPPDPANSLRLFVTLLLFFTPAITMRLVAEEQRNGTIELLLTAPLREWEFVLGKWLAAFVFMTLLIALTGIYPFILSRYTVPGIDAGTVWAAYLGVWLMAAAMLAIGVFISTLFSNQIAAFFAIIAVIILFWVIGGPAQTASPGPLTEVLRALDFSNRFYDNFSDGVVDLADLVYFTSVVVFFLFIAARSVESRRWR